MLRFVNLKEQYPTENTKTWIVMRNPENIKTLINKNEHFWIPELAPSEAFYSYCMKVKNAGNWTKEFFNEVYVPRYIAELRNNSAAMKYLAFLNATESNINIGCTCMNEQMCHRSILAGIMMHCRPDIEVERAYSANQYKQIGRSFFQ